MQLKHKTIQEWLGSYIKYWVIIFLFFTIYGCIYNRCSLGGTWSVKEMTVNNKNFLPYLYINTFGIHCENNSAWFHGSYFFEDDKNATWSVTEKNGLIEFITIKSEIKIYNNKFKVKLEKIEKTNQLHLTLKSDNVYISAYKILDDY